MPCVEGENLQVRIINQPGRGDRLRGDALSEDSGGALRGVRALRLLRRAGPPRVAAHSRGRTAHAAQVDAAL
eukprot:scaffold41831_cov73-Phaeocystis_antarctica.AAC.5